MNTGTFAGYLGRDAELRTTPGGQSVCNFSLGVQTGWGEKKSTLWVGCAIWGERGQKLSQYLTKGTPVTVSGDVDVRAYSSKEGEARAEITCNVQRLTMQGGGAGAGSKPQGESRKPADNAAPAQAAADFDDDIPFG